MTTPPRLLQYYVAQGLALGSLAAVIALLGDIRDSHDLTETQIGVIVGAGFFAAFVTQLTLGRYADRGLAPLMVRLGMLAAGASMIAFALSSTFWAFVAARAVLGTAIGLAQPAIRRTVILADPPRTGRNLGRLGVMEILGFAVIPAVAAVVAGAFDTDAPFYLLAAICVGTVLSMRRLTADDGAQNAEDTSSLQLLRSPVVAGTLILVTSQFLMIGAWEAVWSVSLTDLGAEAWEIGISFTLFAVPLGALAPLAGTWAQRTGGVALCAGGLAASAAAAVLLGVVDSVWGLIGMSMVMGIGSGFGFTAGLFAYSRTISDDRQASAQGLMGATEVLLGGFTSVLGAWLYDRSGRGLVWLVIPALMLGALVVGLGLRSRGSAADHTVQYCQSG